MTRCRTTSRRQKTFRSLSCGFLWLGAFRRVEQQFEITPQMREALPSDFGTLLSLGENERALHDRLDEHAEAFGAPGRIRRIKTLRSFDIAGERVVVRRKAPLAGLADVGMGRVRLLEQRAEKARVVRQVAAQDADAKIDIAKEAIKRVAKA